VRTMLALAGCTFAEVAEGLEALAFTAEEELGLLLVVVGSSRVLTSDDYDATWFTYALVGPTIQTHPSLRVVRLALATLRLRRRKPCLKQHAKAVEAREAIARLIDGRMLANHPPVVSPRCLMEEVVAAPLLRGLDESGFLCGWPLLLVDGGVEDVVDLAEVDSI